MQTEFKPFPLWHAAQILNQQAIKSLHFSSRAVCARDRQHTGESTGAKQYMMGPTPGGAGTHYKISRMPLAFPNRPLMAKVAGGGYQEDIMFNGR